MKKKKRIAFALAAALMMVLLLAACSNKTIRLGVAGTGGVYQGFGEDYAALQAQNGGRFKVQLFCVIFRNICCDFYRDPLCLICRFF